MSPSVTGIFTPESFAPSKEASIEEGEGAPGPSEIANEPITSPSTSFGSSAFFCVAEPAASNASAKK
jgi:hypothetical protein